MEHKKLLAGIGATSMALVLLAGVGFGGVVSADAENTGSGQKPAVGYYLAEESRKSLADNGLMATDYSYFDGLRYTATGQGGAADSNWWGFQSVYMGLSADGSPVDLTQYASVNYELWGISQNANWAMFGLIDADGNFVYARPHQDSGNCLFDGTRYGAGENGADLQVTNYKDLSSDWRGAFVGNMWGEVKVLPTPYNTTSFQGDYVAAFQMDKVVAAFIRYHAYDTKTIQSGKVTLVKTDGTRETVFNPSNATEYTDNITTLTGLNVLTNKKWHFGPQPPRIKEGHTRSEMIAASTAFALTYTPYVERPSTDPAVWDINKVKAGGDVWAKAVEYDEATGSYVGVRSSIDEHDGFVLNIDTTGLISQFVEIDLCLILRIDGVERFFKAFANKVNATYVLEDGTKITNAELRKGANSIPQGIKAKLYVPFGAFEEGEIKLTDINNFGDYTEHLCFIFVNGSFAIGDKMKILSTYTYDCEEHVDANKNQVCDFCTETVPCTEHVDEDENFLCDYCGTRLPCKVHTDDNHDQVCDVCGAEVPCTEHKDEDHNQKCDYCGADVPCTEHKDEDHNQECDYCGAEVPCTEHKDEDHNQECDYCGADVPCTEHKDEDQNQKCDYCGADMENGNGGNDGETEKKSGCGSSIAGKGTITILTVTILVAAVAAFARKKKTGN